MATVGNMNKRPKLATTEKRKCAPSSPS